MYYRDRITPIFKINKKRAKCPRFYISSVHPHAKLLQQAIRHHWAVENNLHCLLDVAFNEDKSTKTNENAVQNFSVLSRIALNLVINEKSKNKKRERQNYWLNA